jgi:uncharacterized protein YjbI with pentapeptide repeats
MAKPEHLEILRQGVEAWNAWRATETTVWPDLDGVNLYCANLAGANFANTGLFKANLAATDLSNASLSNANLSGADLTRANLSRAKLVGTSLYQAYLEANLSDADLTAADLSEVHASKANFERAKLNGANLRWSHLTLANLRGAKLVRADLGSAYLNNADLRGATLEEAALLLTNLAEADLAGANLANANLGLANLVGANLSGATLTGANLSGVSLVHANLVDADLTGCRIYGVAAWDVRLSPKTNQQNLVITLEGEPEVTVDNIEVAQFVYLLLHNEKIRDVIDTVGRKGVLLLGRFTEGRIVVLERLREALRKRGYVPIVFNFDKPEIKDITETVRLLAGLSKFVIADVTNPKSSPLELQATVPEIMVPFQPIIAQGEKPFAMLQDLWIKHRDWVFEPIEYSSVDRLVETIDAEIIRPAEERFDALVMRRAGRLGVRRV